MRADPAASALFLGAFFDELERWGVHDVVVSPGSRSTKERSMARWLAMELLTAPSPSRSPSALESLMYSAIMRASAL